MAVSFIPAADGWKMEYAGLGFEWARLLKERGCDVLLPTMLPLGKTGMMMASELDALGIAYDRDLRAPLQPAIFVDGECFMRSSAPVSLDAAKLSYSLSLHPGIEAAVVSPVLLSYNPSSSAILDSLAFLVPQPRIAIDMSAPEAALGQKGLLDGAIAAFRASVPSLLVSSDQDDILSFLLE